MALRPAVGESCRFERQRQVATVWCRDFSPVLQCPSVSNTVHKLFWPGWVAQSSDMVATTSHRRYAKQCRVGVLVSMPVSSWCKRLWTERAGGYHCTTALHGCGLSHTKEQLKPRKNLHTVKRTLKQIESNHENGLEASRSTSHPWMFAFWTLLFFLFILDDTMIQKQSILSKTPNFPENEASLFSLCFLPQFCQISSFLEAYSENPYCETKFETEISFVNVIPIPSTLKCTRGVIKLKRREQRPFNWTASIELQRFITVDTEVWFLWYWRDKVFTKRADEQLLIICFQRMTQLIMMLVKACWFNKLKSTNSSTSSIQLWWFWSWLWSHQGW